MFELHITCSKDIDKLKIDFSDGTSVVSSKPNKPTKPRKNSTQKSETEESTDFDDFEAYKPSKEVVKPLELPDVTDRPVKIDNILNEFEI